MKLVKNALTPPIVAISVLFFSALGVRADILEVGEGKAYSDIATALANARSGDTVLVDAGTYPIEETLALPSGVTLQSASGSWAGTAIDAQGKCQGVFLSDADSVISGFTVMNGDACKARKSTCAGGGGINIQGGGTVTNCRVTACCLSSTWMEYPTGAVMQGGGGINNYNGTVVDTVIDGCSIAGYSIGVAYLQNGASAVGRRCTVKNCSFQTKSTGMDMATGVVHVEGGLFGDSTVSDNSLDTITSSSGACAVGIFLKSSTVVTNCFVVNNVHKSADSINVAGINSTGGRVVNCVCAWNGKTGDLRDVAGSAEAVDVLTTADLLGGARPTAAVGGRSLTAVFVSPAEIGLAPCDFSLTAIAAGDRTGVVYDWDLDGDGTYEVLGQETVALSCALPATTSVKMRATNAAGDTSVFSHVFRVSAGRVFVDGNSPASAEPYATWGTAARTLSAALACAEVGDGTEIVIREGTYAESSAITVTKGVIIHSETGDRDDVVFDGQKKRANVLTLQHAGAVLAGVTVCGGKNGGALQVLSPGGTVTNCHVTACSTPTAWKNAAGLVMSAGSVIDTLIDDCQGVGNIYGYAVKLSGSGTLMDRCVVTNITAVAGTGNVTCDRTGSGVAAVFCESATIRNSYIAHNNIGLPGASGNEFASGVYFKSGGQLISSTVIDNRYNGGANARVAGICAYNGAVTVRNSIVAENGPLEAADANAVGSFTYDHACTAPLPASGSCNVLASGRIVSETDGLPYPAAGSPVIGQGVYEPGWMEGAVDLAGNPRVGAEQAVDIGAVQYVKPTLSCVFTATQTTALDALDATLTATADGESLDGLVYFWDLDGDGTFEVSGADRQSVRLVRNSPATWTVTLKVTVDSGAEASSAQAFSVYPGNHYVVTENPNAAPPYTSWATAATNIQDAIDAAVAGATVWLRAGTYEPTETVSVEKSLTVRGETGNRDSVVVNGSNTNYVFSLSGSGVVLADLTLTRNGGKGLSGVQVVGGVVTNCHITGCRSSKRWQDSPAVVSRGATLVDCLIDDNGAGERDHSNIRGLGLTQYGGLTERCMIVNNFSETFHLADGSAPPAGGVYLDSAAVMRNCYVAHNRMGECVAGGSVPVTPGIWVYSLSYAGSFCRIANCTVFDNTYDPGDVSGVTGGGGIHAALAENGVLNCLSVGNGRTGSLSEDWSGAAEAFSHCCVGNPSGLGDTSFAVTPTTFRERAGRPHLPANSNAIATGLVDDAQTGCLDLLGRPRTTDTRGRRTICIGCVEDRPWGLSVIIR